MNVHTGAPPADILVVDDSRSNLEVLAEFLKVAGHRVRPVSNGPMALDAVEQRPPDLILLDINMPEMSGYEVCERLKQDERFADIPVLFITALTQTSERLRAFDVGGADYITKPFRLEEVRARVGTHLRIRRLQIHLERQNLALREAHDNLVSLQKMRDNLLHMIVHDLRAPLTGIVSSLKFMEEDAAESAGVVGAADLQQALRSSETLMGLINDLLDIYRMESNALPLILGETHPGELLQSALDLLGPEKNRRILLSCSSKETNMRCDRRLLERAIINLADNALKFSPSHFSVEIQELSENGRWIVQVRDRGPGIPDEYKEKVFEKFGQVEARREGGLPSTGLGLSFCRLVAHAHHGDVQLEDRPGGGSVFQLIVPLSGPLDQPTSDESGAGVLHV